MPMTHPSAYKFYTKAEFTAPMIGLMADYVDNQGMTHAEAAAAFLGEYRETIDLWKN